MGSGSLNAISMLETFYRDDLPKAAAMDLVAGAIKYGMQQLATHWNYHAALQQFLWAV
jgi:20S proteasome alpha/beta subunit